MSIARIFKSCQCPKTVHTIIEERYGKQILEGSKRWEVRLLRGKWISLFIDDRLVLKFNNGKKTHLVRTIVRERDIFDTFEELFNKTDVEEILPGMEKNEAIAFYKQLYRDHANCKVVAFGVEPI